MKRTNRVYTQFFRFPSQYLAIEEKVLPFLLNRVPCGEAPPLDIVVFACCSGAEPFSLSSVLQQRAPGLRFSIRAFDIVPEVIEKARLGFYTRDEVFQSPFVTDDLVEATFIRSGETFRVRSEIAAPVTFALGSLLDAAFMRGLGAFHMVVAQNVLFHLPRPQAREAFTHLQGLLRPRGALFINGMDTDMRVDLTRRFQLSPLEHRIEEIHNEARIDRGAGWAAAYWGREPFSNRVRDWPRKYGTIFLKGAQ